MANRKLATAARPILKWAGGKGQLLERLSAYFPKALTDGTVQNYFEPFLGGGAMFFHVMQKYPLKSAFLMDANEELILLYKVVQRDVEPLITVLGQMEREYLKLPEAKRKERFLWVRGTLNEARDKMDFRKYSSAWVERASQIIFLNKTCFNGLFRVNRSGGFNVPFGKYLKPTIADPPNLRATSALLAKASILLGDFGDLASLDATSKGARVKSGSFIYFDPPYRPLSRTASFTSYSRFAFGDGEQQRLAKMFRDLDLPGVYQMLSNSDPKNSDPNDDFFEEQYSSYKDTFYRVPASRSINSDPSRRGRINEIVITNYRS
ncbi:MAG: Dam family site-specific DNA-(adenine-N6)-methyltransferase [Fibrobacterota bacterium]|nr:Dam family site-specific DNA-(adenine-N6)-methyltransferase [Fibrobacterota bacterium]